MKHKQLKLSSQHYSKHFLYILHLVTERRTDVEHRNFFFFAQKYLFCNTKKLFFSSIFLFASTYSF